MNPEINTRYVGSKIIHAEPMTKGMYNTYNNLNDDEYSEELGYIVKYADGYISWSPKAAFDAAYRHTTNMSFSDALEAIKSGILVSRKGWHGNGMYVSLAVNIGFKLKNDKTYHNASHTDIGNHALVIVTPNSDIKPMQVGWVPSQADLLEDDWYILEE